MRHGSTRSQRYNRERIALLRTWRKVGFARDAIQLLNMLSLFHYHDVTDDYLRRAAEDELVAAHFFMI
jgi:hypothetical protein